MEIQAWSQDFKTFSTLNLAEHETFPAHNVQMPTIVDISTLMSRRNSIIGLSEPEKAEFLDISILMSIKNAMFS